MRKLALAGMLLLVFQVPGQGQTITFALQPSDTRVFKTESFSVFSDDFNGRTLNGQTLSLDLLLDGDNLARVFSQQMGLSLTVFTDAGTFPGFAGQETVAAVIGSTGELLSPLQKTGRAMSDTGSFSAGLPFLCFHLS